MLEIEQVEMKAKAAARAASSMARAWGADQTRESGSNASIIKKLMDKLKESDADRAQLLNAIRADLTAIRASCNESRPDCADSTPCVDCPNNNLRKTMTALVAQTMKAVSG